MADGAGTSGPPVEIEVKLAVHDSRAIRSLVAHPDSDRLAGFSADGTVRVDEIVDLYLDTAAGDGMLRAAGLRARLRVSANGVVLAVKGRSSMSADGVTTRMELEAPATADLDPRRWPASDARTLVVDTIEGHTLVEIAALRQRRQVCMLRRREALVELSVDELTAVDADGSSLGMRVELEAELKAGPADALSDLARTLSALEGVGPPLGSKLEFALGARMER